MKRIKQQQGGGGLEMVRVPDFMQDLPDGIASNIFSRLPSNTILNCLVVRKSWRNILTSIFVEPGFGQKHLEEYLLQKEHPDTITGFLLLMKIRNNSEKLELYLAEYVEDYSYQVNRIPCPSWPSHRVAKTFKKFVGSCNGLICLSQRINKYTVDFDPIYLYNPMLKEYLDLPGRLSNYSDDYSEQKALAVGFGFHPITKKYKVVRIHYRKKQAAAAAAAAAEPAVGEEEQEVQTETADVVGEVEIYTLGEGQWKSGRTTTYQLQYSKDTGVLFNGSLHWLIQKEIDQPVMIISFDLSTEEFGVVPSPPDLPTHDADTVTYFKDFGGCLCVAHVTEGQIRFWILMGNDFWIRRELNLEDTPLYLFYRPYAFRRNLTQVLLSCTTSEREEVLCFYDFDNENLVEVVRMEGRREDDVVPHTKSFVSLKAMGEDAKTMSKTN